MRIGGTEVNDVKPKDRDIAMVFQNYALYPHMTVADNIGFALKLRQVPKDEISGQVAEAADILDLSSTSTASRASCRAASASAWRWVERSCASRRRS